MGRQIWNLALRSAALVFWLVPGGLSVFAQAQEWPTLGLLYNVKETGSLNYACRLDGGTLECEFVQISVRLKGKASDKASELEKAKRSYPEAQKEIGKKQCAEFEAYGTALATGKPPPGADLKRFTAGMAQMTSLQRKDLTALMDAMRRYCKDPTEANYLSIVETGLDRDSRTCMISANPYKQRFKQVLGSNVWVVAQDGPEGSCGVVNVSRFESEKSLNLSFWKYYARKTVTNRSGEAFPGMSCTDLDEGEYEYDWSSREKQFSCDYLTFGLF